MLREAISDLRGCQGERALPLNRLPRGLWNIEGLEVIDKDMLGNKGREIRGNKTLKVKMRN